MKKKWVVLAKGADFNKIAAKFNISPYLARIIRNRDRITDEQIDEFLNAGIDKMHDAALLRDMESACAIIEDAVEAGAAMRIVGDYDIDGVCASYILKKAILAAGGIADVRLPDRVKDGYGISEKMIRQAADDGIELIITCDNGIAAAKETELAMSLGMSMIITDHHEVPYEEAEGRRRYIIPSADAVVDPKREDCPYPFKGICGAMVAYKFVCCLFDRPGIGETVTDKADLLDEFLMFAAFATVGDIMELTDENRVAVKYGLKLLKNTSNTGMRALIEATNLNAANITAYHIGFILGPCINATGRLETADAALDLFFETDHDRALEAARGLVRINESRKNMTNAFSEKAVRITREEHADDKVLVVYIPECHESLAGIVAGRLREYFWRPSIVLTDDMEGNIKGSGRSIEGYNMYDELSKIKDMFTRFGGHAMAAGLSMPAGSADELRKKLNYNCTLTDDDLVEKLKIDIPLPVGYANEGFVEELSRLEPFGVGNARPLFAEKDVPIRSINLAGRDRKVVKLVLEGKDAKGGVRPVEAVCFDDAEHAYEELCERKTVSIVYQAGINEYNGRRSVSLTIKDYM